MNFFLAFTILFSSWQVFASGSAGSGAASASQGSSVKNLKKNRFEKFREKRRKAGTSLGKKRIDHSKIHKPWDEILKENITSINNGKSTELDYKNVDKKKLKNYTDTLLSFSKKEVSSWNKEDTLAYYFNLYNSLTVQFLLPHIGKIKSIRDLGSGVPFFSSPWKKKFFVLFGEKSHLDKIEHELVRADKKLFDYRLHFAFNCASVGCPALQNEAYKGAKLEKQLQMAEENFLLDRTRNRFNSDKGRAEISAIMKWYKSDFAKSFGSLENYLAEKSNYLTNSPKEQQILRAKEASIRFLKYDWKLNIKK